MKALGVTRRSCLISGVSLISAALTAVLAGEPQRGATGPDHLVPCRPLVNATNWELELTARINTHFGLEQPPAFDPRGELAFRMYVRPDRPPYTESVVSVYLPDTGEAVVESVSAKKSIWYANVDSSGFVPTRKKVRVPIEKQVATLPRETAASLSRALGRAITRVRFPDIDPQEIWVVLHGTGYTFEKYQLGYGNTCGGVVSPPDTGEPGRLVEIGSLLVEYARANAESRASVVERIQLATAEVP